MTFAAMLIAASLTQQSPATERFRITVGQNVVTGTEQFRIARTPQGTHITGTIHNQRPGAAVDGVEDETLAADGGLVRYRLEVTVAGAVQTIDAWRDGDSVRMRASAGGQILDKAAPFSAPRSLVLDNLVVSHFQVLLDLLARPNPRAETDWWLYVPQALTAVRGTVAAATADRGTLDGRPLALRKVALDAAGTLVNVWADAATNRLMRVTVPIQQVEIVREGFTPAAAAATPAAPATFTERPITVTSEGEEGSVSLGGTLSLPAHVSGKVPVVVLVHGSGPNDRDETIGPNKPFADIAHGLAAAGIATLRYDKRTFALRGQGRFDARTLTVDQEAIDDAVAAVALARGGGLPEVDPTRVYLLGHSLGGTLGPLIAARVPAGSLRGLILAAPGARPLDETIEDQVAMRLRVSGQPAEESTRQVQALQEAFARVRSGAAPDTEVVFFAPAHYWRDLFARTPLKALAALPLPVLVLQGGKDYQVTRADYDLVAAALASKPAALRELRWFPELNHLFMPVAGGGESTGAEYGAPAHVDPRVIAAIVAWIHR
jgi:pimeloyl-ACP methyl ester carboxylesterase